MKAQRLLSILLHMQNHGKITCRELAERLEVSERTILRDMEALSAAGIPVYAERGSHGGWSLTEGYRTTLTGMSAEEIGSLVLANASHLLGDLGMEQLFQAAVQKLLAASAPPIRLEAEMVRQRTYIDGAGWHPSTETFPLLHTVQEALWGDQKLRIQYPRGESHVERTVAPLGLVAKRNTWYLVAEVDGDLRTYRISRLLHAEVLAESFTRPDDFDLESYWKQSLADFKSQLPRYPARIRIAEKLLPRLERERYTQLLHTVALESGWLDVDLEFNTLESACEVLLSYGASVQVLEPEELRNQVLAEARAILQRYES